jgi:hypothetical protein
MPRILKEVTLDNGHKLLIAHSVSSVGRCFGEPVRLTLVETDGTEYRRSDGRNVLRVIDYYDTDDRRTGARSGYRRAVLDLSTKMKREAGNSS